MQPTPWDPEGVTVSLDPDGQLVSGTPPTEFDVKQLYKALVAARCLDMRLSRAELPMWVSAAGEEAALAGVGLLARPNDWVYAGYRDAAVALAKGVPLEALVAQLVAPAAQHSGRFASATHRIEAPSDSLGMQLPIATGRAHAQKLRTQGEVTFESFGEGLTTTGAFHESSMLAVACKLPVVFVCRSQLWPDGAPAEAGALGDCVADRVKAAGFWVQRVDGADAWCTYNAIARGAERARQGQGPAFIEVVVTPMHRNPPAHRDPLERLRRYLDRSGAWTQTLQDVIEAEVRTELERSFDAVAASMSQANTPS